jgi:hypothetical protein
MKLRSITIGRIILLIYFAVFSVKANADGKATVFELSGDFEGNSVPGKFTYQQTSSGLSIKYYSSSKHEYFSYNVEKFDECSSLSMYQIPNTRQIAIDGSCSSQGGQIYINIYEWKSTHDNWCLVREITGEKSDSTSNTVIPSEQISRVTGCVPIGKEGPYAYEKKTQVKSELDDEFNKFRVSTRNQTDLLRYLNTIPSYTTFEISSNIDATNVQAANDLAYYLTESGRALDAIPILVAIVKKFPNRVVAKLNLADAYWANDFKDLARIVYRDYYRQMIFMKLQSKIPENVSKRMK